MLFPFGGREEEIREGQRGLCNRLTSGDPSCFPLPVAANHNNQNTGCFRPYLPLSQPTVRGSEQSPAHREDPVHADCPWSEQITFWQRKKKPTTWIIHFHPEESTFFLSSWGITPHVKSLNSTTSIEQQLFGWYRSGDMETNSEEDLVLVFFFLSSWTERGICRPKVDYIFE